MHLLIMHNQNHALNVWFAPVLQAVVEYAKAIREYSRRLVQPGCKDFFIGQYLIFNDNMVFKMLCHITLNIYLKLVGKCNV